MNVNNLVLFKKAILNIGQSRTHVLHVRRLVVTSNHWWSPSLHNQCSNALTVCIHVDHSGIGRSFAISLTLVNHAHVIRM